MQVLNRLHTDHPLSGSQGRKHDKCTIRLGDLADLVHPAEQNAVNLGSGNCHVLDEEPDTGKEFMNPELGLLNRLGRLARNQNLGRISALGIGWTVAVTPGEGRREVDGRVGDRLDELDILPVAPTQELVHGGVEGGGVHNSPKLAVRVSIGCSSSQEEREAGQAYKLVNVDEHACLGVLRGQVVTVDGHAPTLVPQQVYIAVQAAGQWGELGAEEKDVDAAVHRRLVEEVCHRLLQDTLGEIGHQMAIHDDGRATLF